MTPRDIEKLQAIGYTVPFDGVAYDCFLQGEDILEHRDWEFEHMAWGACKAHAQSPDGMKATMAEKVRFIGRVVIRAPVKGVNNWDAWQDEPDDIEAEGDSPEAAVDALFWKVP